jgi:hypothetical protein
MISRIVIYFILSILTLSQILTSAPKLLVKIYKEYDLNIKTIGKRFMADENIIQYRSVIRFSDMII